jgi:hypothetical protein
MPWADQTAQMMLEILGTTRQFILTFRWVLFSNIDSELIAMVDWFSREGTLDDVVTLDVKTWAHHSVP